MRLAMLAATLVIAGVLTPARADLVVTVQNGTINVGGTATLDVLIRSTTGTDNLENFGLNFSISPATPSRVEFVTPPVSYYIFGADSGLASIPAPIGEPGAPDNTTFDVADLTISGDGITLGSSDQLLVRLHLTAATGLPPTGGETFNVGLVGSYFFDALGNEYTLDGASDLIGTLTVPAPVPEPASLALLGVVGGGAALWRWRRQRRQASPVTVETA